MNGRPFVHAAAQDLENSQNPLGWRSARVASWLAVLPRADVKVEDLVRRTQELTQLGLRNFDAFHVASAELARADVLATTDDRLLAFGRQHAGGLGVRVMDVVALAPEGLAMRSVIVDPVELRRRGFEALVAALGWVNAVRFVRQYETGQGDYTRERDAFLPDWNARTLVERAFPRTT